VGTVERERNLSRCQTHLIQEFTRVVDGGGARACVALESEGDGTADVRCHDVMVADCFGPINVISKQLRGVSETQTLFILDL
jgi:hypothetical protein